MGFFHSDPHPGNMLRLNDQSEYKLALIDFGLVAQVVSSSCRTTGPEHVSRG